MPSPRATGRATERRPERLLARRGGVVELLRVPALAFRFASRLRGALYDRGWLPTDALDVPVVSVGNLSVGGTGKTPMVALLVKGLVARGRRPGILSRGYGSKAGESNDEARLLARLLPEVPHVQDAQRARGGRRLVEREGCDVVVLDDGFQHRRLRRDLDLVLVDATRPWGLPAAEPPEGDGNEPVCDLLPRGLLREWPGALARADGIVVTRSDQLSAEGLERLTAELERLAPGRPLLLARHAPCSLRPLSAGSPPAHPSGLRGREVDLVSGLGNPDAFEATVCGLGARVREHRRYPDHHAFGAGDLAGLGGEGRWVVTSEKDAVKLTDPVDGLVDGGNAIYALGVELEIGQGAGVLEALLDALPAGRPLRERRSLHEGLHG